MMYRTSLRFVVGFAPLMSLLGAAWLPAGTAWGQESATPKPAPVDNADTSGEETKIAIVYQLKHVDTELSHGVARVAIPGAMVTLDSARNRLIVFGSPLDHERLHKILKEIDVPSETGKKQIKVFHLTNSNLESMMHVIRMIVDDKKVNIAADSRTNSLLAEGPEDSLRVIEAVLMKLDTRPTPGLPEKTFRVRIVWFTEGTAGNDAVEQDDDLQIVTEQLSKVGAGPMFPSGQTIIHAAPGGMFQISCATAFGEGPAILDIQGNLDIEQQTTRLEIQISVMREQPVGANSRCRDRLFLVS